MTEQRLENRPGIHPEVDRPVQVMEQNIIVKGDYFGNHPLEVGEGHHQQQKDSDTDCSVEETAPGDVITSYSIHYTKLYE